MSNRSMPGEFLDMVKYPWRGAGSSLSLRSFSLWELWLSQKEGSAVEWKGWKRTGLGADAMVVVVVSVLLLLLCLLSFRSGHSRQIYDLVDDAER